MPPVRLPSDVVGLRSFLVPINQETTVSQTFTMTADGLGAVEVRPDVMGGAVSGWIEFELTEEGSGVTRRGGVAAASLVPATPYRFEFAPINDSKDARFRLDLRSSETAPVIGLAVWATKGERYADGALQINGRDRWADLAFRTSAPAGRSIWDRLIEMDPPPPGISSRIVILSALAAYMLISGFVLRAFARFHS